MDLELQGKVALVTGGSQGIGRATAIGLAREGLKVAIAARGAEELNQVAREIRSAGGTALALAGDVTKDADRTHMVN